MKKVLIVTGGSRGIGAATAKLAATQGYAVCVNYLHNQQAANAVVADIQASGGIAIAMQADLAVEAQIEALFERVDQELGPLTALVNNAGILEQQSGLLDMDQGRLQRVFAANVIGPMLCAREAVKRMSVKLGGKGGAIVNVSSVASRLGAPGEYIDYAASKGALDSFTLGLSKEVADQGIRVNSVRPGFIYTDIHASGGEPGRVDRIKDSIPMKRGGQPEEVAQAILWLLSAQASYATGTFIDLAGGR
ncbi:SDR family oxidoreductase [Rheinheimera faecalis]|uniref:SDR family oxidoreductase n=1 Tax=Rheinheimera faecalis TaxID=2901141 RepID=UPI001E43494A|nr:SDR family oxidoreductase [Rheinheimera faecalis]